MDINAFLGPLRDLLKEVLSNPYFLGALWLVGTFLLFSPPLYLNYFDLTVFRDTHKPWIGIITLLSFAFWFSIILRGRIARLSEWNQFRKARAESISRLNALSPEESFVIMACLVRNRQTIILPFSDPAATSLREKGLISLTGNGTLLRWPHIIPDYLWKRLRSKPPDWMPTAASELEDLRRAADEYFGDDVPFFRH